MTSFSELGFERHRNFLSDNEITELSELFEYLPDNRPGHRLAPAALSRLASVDRVQKAAAKHIGASARPVRVLLFDKRDGGNWALGWHQDRTIEVQDRIDVAGFGPWTVKQGRPHVAPPISLLENMVTVRLHIDPVDHANSPLIIALGSHRLGLVPEKDIQQTVDEGQLLECLAEAGDIWLYPTLILHASSRAAPGRRRRVVQIDFSADKLPGGLVWSTST